VQGGIVQEGTVQEGTVQEGIVQEGTVQEGIVEQLRIVSLTQSKASSITQNEHSNKLYLQQHCS
jgi:hypothetical protein